MKNFTFITSILLIIITIFGCNSTPNDSNVKDAARAAIIHKLKDPNTAKFHHNEVINDLGNDTFTYTETVNAKNSFGGSVAHIVNVKIKWAGGSPSDIENWRLLDIRFNER